MSHDSSVPSRTLTRRFPYRAQARARCRDLSESGQWSPGPACGQGSSITEFAAAAQEANKNLFVRGCVTSPDAAGNFYYDLKGTSPPKKQKGVKSAAAPQDARVISANALDKTVPNGWQKELLKAGFAITHDKIVVIDPFADDNHLTGLLAAWKRRG
jgi:hypothetical protein